jgi:hypothetical protein
MLHLSATAVLSSPWHGGATPLTASLPGTATATSTARRITCGAAAFFCGRAARAAPLLGAASASW